MSDTGGDMLYILLVDGDVQRVVDSATELDRLPANLTKAMCKALQVPWRGVDGELVRVVPVRAQEVRRWDVSGRTQS